jgi:hypothetical protein
MKIVIQCAARKDPNAGTLRNPAGKRVLFVAHPEKAPQDAGIARPDDVIDGKSWRDLLLEYDANPEGNPLGLLPAYQLYAEPSYGALARHFGRESVYILSAGWGLIRSDFLTPAYDITFSAQADAYKRRRKSDPYDDLAMIDLASSDQLIFFGGKDYLPLFCRLTEGYAGERIVGYNAKTAPQKAGIRFIRYPTSTRTNWHYQAVRGFLSAEFLSG